MKYSVRGFRFPAAIEGELISTVNLYSLWKLEPKPDFERNLFSFEVWVNSETQKTSLFNRLKSYVDIYENTWIDWHECTHDEENPLRCDTAERYGEVIR